MLGGCKFSARVEIVSFEEWGSKLSNSVRSNKLSRGLSKLSWIGFQAFQCRGCKLSGFKGDLNVSKGRGF